MSNKEKISYPPQWCRFCKYFGYFKRYNACYKGNVFKILFYGPKVVRFDGYCDSFKYAKKYQNEQRGR